VADASGAPILDGNGRIQPVFAPGGSAIFKYIADPDAVLNIDTNSLYAQDHWRVSDRLSLDLGVRFEHVSSSATDTTNGIDASRAVPRLAAAFDADGTGRYVFHATYAHYSGRYDEALIGSNSPVGNPIEIDGIYKGPAGQGLGFGPGLDPNNYNYNNVYASFPSANVKFASGVHSPLTKEVTLSAGAAPNGRLSGQVTYVHRRTGDLIEDFVSLANGTTHVVQPGVDLTLTNRVFRNSDIPKREYDGMVFQVQSAAQRHLKVNGAWTLQLKNDGNYEGESSGQIVASPIGDYPEIFSEAFNFPAGHLSSFQRSKVDVWGIYDMSWGRFGNATVSALWRYNSARVYSLAAKISGVLTATQAAALAAAGYPDAPQSQTVFYDEPGSERFAGYAVVDTSLNWELPLHKTLRPWVKIDVFNLLNDQKLINWNTSIKPDAASPANAMGIPTGFVKSASFGQPVGNTSFPTPFAGQTGGRTLRVALGIRF
jgi:hypothetical protein